MPVTTMASTPVWQRIEGFCQRTATLVARGHELGSHTFAHCHSWDTNAKEFERSILEKRIVRIKAVPPDRVYGRASAMARNGGIFEHQCSEAIHYIRVTCVQRRRQLMRLVKTSRPTAARRSTRIRRNSKPIKTVELSWPSFCSRVADRFGRALNRENKKARSANAKPH